MPLKRITNPDGSAGWIRKAFAPTDYRVPQAELQRLASFGAKGYGSLDELALHDGAFASYKEIRRFERDGKQWVLLTHAKEYAIEVELTSGKPFEVRPLAPEEAWRLARERDAQNPSFEIGFEGQAP